MGYIAQPGTGRGRPGIKRNRPAHNRRLNPDRVATYAARGLSTYDISKLTGVGQAAVWRFLHRYKTEKAQLEEFKTHRADVLASLQGKALSVQERMLDHLLKDGVLESLDDRSKASIVNSINNVMGTAFDKERLERGQSTANTRLIASIMGSALDSAYDPAIEPPKVLEISASSHTPHQGVRLESGKTRRTRR